MMKEKKTSFSDISSGSASPITASSLNSAKALVSPNGAMPVITYGVAIAPNTSPAPTYTTQETYRTYKRRWFILFLFVMYSMANAFQWIEYSIIANNVSAYYGIDPSAVNWCSTIFMITYIPLIFPGMWITEKKGLRTSVIIGSFGTMIGSWIKCLSVGPDLFMVTFAGQVLVAVSNVLILGIPPRLAAVWFGSDQVSTACAIGVFGNQLGIAMGFLIPPILVPTPSTVDHPTSTNLTDTGNGLYLMFIIMAAVCTVLFALILAFFNEKPQTPPNAAADCADVEVSASYMGGILRLIQNRGYVLLLLSYGINVGAFYAISTLLNQVVIKHFPDDTENAGQIGLLIVVAGMIGSVVCGFILDKTAKFKLVTLFLYVMSLGCMLGYTFIFEVKNIYFVFPMAAALGFFMTGYLPVGFEFAAELTFPEPEGTSSGLLNASAQVFGIIGILADEALLEKYGDKAANMLLVAMLAVGTLCTAAIREDLRRQKARKSGPPAPQSQI